MVWRKAYFNISNLLGVTHKCDIRTDGGTVISVANAACNYVAWPKSRDDGSILTKKYRYRS